MTATWRSSSEDETRAIAASLARDLQVAGAGSVAVGLVVALLVGLWIWRADL